VPDPKKLQKGSFGDRFVAGRCRPRYGDTMPSAFVLAAGLGTRLRPLSDHLPKPLVPVGDKPALAHVLEQARVVGPVVVNAFHKADAILAFGTREAVDVVCEPSLLGTAGGLRHAASRLLAGPVLVWNADILTALDGSALLDAHIRSDALATLAVAPRPLGLGTVGLDAAGRVVRLRGERFGAESRGADFVGIHVVGPELREALPEVGCLVGDVYLPALRAGGTLGSFHHAAPFFDVGTMASYLDANLAWLDTAALSSWMAQDASVVGGAHVTRSIVGEGARVEANLEACVVWPGSVATSPERRAIVTPFGTFRGL
jgi:mannose-1-phosphate guanylyltransferase